jgi:hypothetical protein
MAIWSIQLNGVTQSWKTLEIHRKLVLNTPTTFSATIAYSSGVHFMDVVTILRDNIIEWKGFVENIDAMWDNNGQYLNISGRDITLILWKKYCDDFSNFAQKTAGFFGTVDPVELLMFLLHTPKSEIGPAIYSSYDIDGEPSVDSKLISGYPYNKEGWGLDFSSSLGTPIAYLNGHSGGADSKGNPAWAIARQRGYGWFNSGKPSITSVPYPSNAGTVISIYGTPDSVWSTHGSSPYINGTPNLQSYSNYVSSTVAGTVSTPQNIIFNMNPFDFTGIDVQSITITVTIQPNSILSYNPNATVNVSLWLDSIQTWIPCAVNVGLSWNNGSWITQTIDISQSVLQYLVDLESSNLRIKITSPITSYTDTYSNYGCKVSVVKLTAITSSSSGKQTSGDYFMIPIKGTYWQSNSGPALTYPTITALYFECRQDTSTYPRNYTVEYTTNVDMTNWAVIPNTSPPMPQTNNTTSDILISFPPLVNVSAVRMRLIEDQNGVAWGVSQVYIYMPETYTKPKITVPSSLSSKYKVYLDTGESDPSGSPSAYPYNYTGGPYIKAFNNQLSVDANPVGPLNISRQRLLDAVNYIVGLSSSTDIGDFNTVGFSPFEWWLSYDSNNTFNIAKLKGSNKSSTIIFKMDPSDPTNTNIGSCDYQTFIDDTVQNIYVVGQGEQKQLEDCSLWVKSVDASGNATNGLLLSTAENVVRTFYEDAVQDKTVIINDNDYPAVGNIIGSANLSVNAMPRIQLTIIVTKDQYTSMSYDVGDIVKVIDTLNGIGDNDPSNGNYRIQNIDINVSQGVGENVSITLGYPNYKFEDELQTWQRNLKSYGIVGTFKSDWSAEGTDKQLLDANLISTTSQYSVNAQNDKMIQSIPYDGNYWITRDFNLSTSGLPAPQVSPNFHWDTNGTWFGIQANTDNAKHRLQVVLNGNLISYYDGSTVVNGSEAANIRMIWNPHLVMDVKCCDGTSIDLAGAKWSYDHWVQGSSTPLSGDFSRIGIATPDGRYGFWFMFIKNSNDSTQNPALFDVYAQWSLPADPVHGLSENTNIAPMGLGFNSPNASYTDPSSNVFQSPNGSFLMTIAANRRYKIEILTQSDPIFIATAVPNVKFNIYEYKTAFSTDNQGITVSYIQLTYPTLAIVTSNAIYNMMVKPLYAEFNNVAHSTGTNNQPSIIYFYNYETDWTIKQLDEKGM